MRGPPSEGAFSGGMPAKADGIPYGKAFERQIAGAREMPRGCVEAPFLLLRWTLYPGYQCLPSGSLRIPHRQVAASAYFFGQNN